MTRFSHQLGMFLLILGTPVWAQPQGEYAAAQPPQPPEVLLLAPADAALVLYADDPAGLFGSEALRRALPARAPGRGLSRALAETFDGPLMISISGTMMNPFTWRVTLATRTRADRAAFFDRISGTLAGAWNAELGPSGVPPMNFYDDGEVGVLTLPPPIMLPLAVGYRDGLVYASTMRADVAAWQLGQFEPTPVTENDLFTRAAGDAPQPDVLLFVDTRTLMPALDAMMQVQSGAPRGDAGPQGLVDGFEQQAGLPPGLLESFDLARLEAVSLVAPRSRAEPLRLTLAVQHNEPGPVHLFASTPAASTLAEYFPKETTLFIHGAMKDGREIIDDLRAFLGAIDEQIISEFDEESGEFRSETGIDPQEAFANFGPEWAIGARFAPSGPEAAVFAVRVHSEDAFQAHMSALRDAFELQETVAVHRGVPVHNAVRALGPAHYALIDGVLLVSSDEEAMTATIDAKLDERSLATAARFKAARWRVAEKTSKLVYVNLVEAVEAGAEDMSPVEARLAETLKAQQAVAIALVGGERIMALELAFAGGDEEDGASLAGTAAGTVLDFIAEQRRVAMKQVSMMRVQQAVMACHMFASANEGRLPHDLTALTAGNFVFSGDPAEAFGNPYAGLWDEDPYEGKVFYLYRNLGELRAIANPAGTVVVSEPLVHDGGAVFGYADGHVEWIRSPEAEELLAVMKSGR